MVSALWRNSLFFFLCLVSSNTHGMFQVQGTLTLRRMYIVVLFHDMPWHHLDDDLPRHLTQHTTEPSTHLHGIRWNLNPILDPNPNLGVTMTFRRVAMECRVGCRGGCHRTTRGMPRHPPRRAMKSYGTPWDAVGMPSYGMGVTMAMQRKLQME